MFPQIYIDIFEDVLILKGENMGFFNNFKNMMSGSAEEEYYEESLEYQDNNSNVPAVSQQGTTRRVKPSRAVVTVVEPRVYAEVENMATLLMQKNIVIVNFKRMDKAQAERVIDYMTGIIFAIDGSTQKLQSELFLFTPGDVSIDGVLEDNENSKMDYLDMV